MQTAKTDNHAPGAKLALRRALLNRLPAGTALDVCDCFGAREILWTQLRREYHVANYISFDLKPRRGRLKLDSLRYLETQRWRHNVVDLDAYGSPWRHWFEVLRRGLDEVTVFLTCGVTVFGAQQGEAMAALGIPFEVPTAIQGALAPLIVEHCLGQCHTRGYSVAYAMEALNPGGSCRYFGLHLVKTTNQQLTQNDSRHPRANSVG